MLMVRRERDVVDMLVFWGDTIDEVSIVLRLIFPAFELACRGGLLLMIFEKKPLAVPGLRECICCTPNAAIGLRVTARLTALLV